MSSFVKILNFPGEISIKLNVIAVPCTGQREIMARIGFCFGTVPTVDFMRQVNTNTSSRRPRTGFVYTATLLTWQTRFFLHGSKFRRVGEGRRDADNGRNGATPIRKAAWQGTALLGFSKLGRSRSRGGVLPWFVKYYWTEMSIGKFDRDGQIKFGKLQKIRTRTSCPLAHTK